MDHFELLIPVVVWRAGVRLGLGAFEMANNNGDPSFGTIVKWVFSVVLALTLVVVAWMGLTPLYNVYHQRMEGEAMYEKSQWSKKVMVQDALAREESAKSLAQAEIIRAEGVAKANEIIGKSLINNPDYLTYLWIHNLEGNENVIYVATEMGMPISEAGSRFQPRKPRLKSGDIGTPENTDPTQFKESAKDKP